MAFGLGAVTRVVASSLVVSGNVTISAPATYDSVLVTGNGVLTADALITARTLFLVQPGGKVMHSDYAGGTIYKLELAIEPGGLLDIQSNGSIYVSGKGLRGGVGRQNGEGYDASGLTITRVNGGRAGGSHGGRGGWQGALDNSGPAYGMADSPSLYGGGGGAFFNGLYGGDGGGIVLIHAAGATVHVDGTIRSNGLNGVNNDGQLANDTGGGSGGTIAITCGVIEGGGVLEAYGGSAGFLGGGGGGGRIAVFYEDANEIAANQFGVGGGTAQGLGGGGTIYAQHVGLEPYGHVTIQGNTSQYETPLRLLVPHLAELVVRGGTLAVVEPDVNVDGSSDAVGVEASIGVSSASRLRFAAGASVVATGLTVETGGSAFLDPNTGFQSVLLVVTGPGARLESDIDLDYRDAGDVFEVSNGGVIVNRAVFGLSAIDGMTMKGGANETVFYNEGTLVLPDGVDEHVIIASGMTLAESGLLTPDDAIRLLTIQPGGKVTHSDYAGGTIHKLELTIEPGGMLDVQSNGSIDVSGKGLRGGVGRQNGEGYDASGVTITRVNGVRAGGSHGGRGGWQGAGDDSGPTYGMVDNPSLYGGGGGANFVGLFGGDGGGIVLIHAAGATVRVDGSIRSNGFNGIDRDGHLADDTGGGAGGSIAITCGAIEGVGTLEANGGASGFLGGGGGGGRIAVFYDNPGVPTSNLSASGGGGGNPGGVGTVFVNSTRVGTDLTTADSLLTLSPDGSFVFRVTMRDSNGDPIVGETGIWLDFSGCMGLVPCPSIAGTWPIVQQSAPSSWGGLVEFGVKAGGCTSGLVAVKSAQGLIALVPIRSLDRNGTLTVSAFDFAGDACSDLNNDGTTNVHDWDILARYIGRTCISDASAYFTVDAYTQPGPDRLFPGSIIQVWAKIHNTAPEPAVLDSLVFETAGWGIANSWKFLSRDLSVPVPASGDLYSWTPFTIPGDVPRHGCFRVRSYPRFTPAAATIGAEQNAGHSLRLATNSPPGNTRQINRDSRNPPCPPAAWMVAEQHGFGPRRHALTASRLERAAVGSPMTATESTAIPIGTAFGSQLTLFEQAFLPPGWSYTISESGTITAPDTILVSITHPVPVACVDTARVVVQAYATGEVFAGEAEVYVYALGPLGDVNASGTIDSLDVYSMKNWLLGGPELANPDAMDLTGDRVVDVADLVHLVDAVYAGAELDCAEIPMAEDYGVHVLEDGDSTTVLFDPNRSIRGVQILMVGTGSGGARSSFDGILELSTASSGDSLAVLLTDLDGSIPIEGPMAYIRVQGSYSFQVGRFADAGYHPGNMVVEPPLPVLVSEFSAEPGNSGVSLRWEIRSDEEVIGFTLYRRTALDDAPVVVASESELVASTRAFTDTRVEGGHTYEYVLGVRMADGTEVLSPTVDVTAKKFELSLFQNHPNPFNPATTITFTLPERMEVELAIYNVLGQLVSTVVAEKLDEGFHEARWEGKDNAGSPVSSGVYFYRLIAGNRALTRKMVLLK